MPLSDIIDMQISLDTAGITQAGFGMPLILSANAAFGERVRTYSDLDGVDDDFAVTTPEYLAAQAIFAQDPKPPTIAIGRRALKPTQRWKLSIATVLNNTAYKVRVNSQIATFTSGGAATEENIVAGLVSAINALTDDTLTASDQTTFVRLTGNAAGNWNGVEILDNQGRTGSAAPSYLLLEQDHADPGVATDLAAILTENDTWYGLYNLYNSKAEVQAIAAWTESNEKLFLADTQDTVVITTAVGGTDVADDLKDSSYFRTAAVYHPANDEFLGAAILGRCLPLDPGSETWMFKTLAGVAVYTLTSTHLTNLRAKNCGYYYSINDRAITAQGKVASGEFIDTVRFRDWFKARTQERMFLTMLNNEKVPYTDPGINLLAADLKAQISEGIAVGGIATDPEPTVTVPKARDAAPADKAARLLRGLKFTYTLAGAIHKVEVRGNVSA